LLPYLAWSQIPNAGFENWTGSEPDGWTTSNDSSSSMFPVTKSTNSHSGLYAMQGTVVSVFSINIAPIAISAQNNNGFPVNTRYGFFMGFLRFTSVSGDRAFISAALIKGGVGIAAAVFYDSLTRANYLQFVAPFSYITSETPDTALIVVTIVPAKDSTFVHMGSTFLLDDLSFSGVNAVTDGPHQPLSFSLSQNYPNPFNPTTKIQYDVPHAAHVTIQVYNLLGQVVSTIVNQEKQAGSYNAEWNAIDVPSGVYLYRLEAGDVVKTKRMILVK
jgi:hypothetical protein